MPSPSPQKTQIEDLIRNSEFGITPSQIAVKLAIAWRTVDKYLKELLKEGRVTSHAVGPYSVFMARKMGEQRVYELLYIAAVKIGASLVVGEEYRPEKVARIMRETWETLGNKVTLPFENEIPKSKGPPTAEFFEDLIRVIKKMLSEFGYFGNYPKAETIPPVGNTSSMTRLIQLKDPGFIPARTWTHYHLMANFLEYKLTKLTGIPVFFHVAGEIKPEDEMVYFEIGLVEFYFIDFSIVEHSDASKDVHFFLDGVNNFFTTFLRSKFKQYLSGDALHYEVKFLDNHQVEMFFALREKSYRRNIEIIEKLKLKTQRKWVPYEEWPEHPYLVMDFVSNIGFALDNYFLTMTETWPIVGYNIWVESLPQGKRISFLEPFDFDIFLLNILDEAAIRDHYRRLGITSEEFLSQRKQGIKDLWAEYHRELQDKKKQRQ